MAYLPDKTQPRAVRHALVVVEGAREVAVLDANEKLVKELKDYAIHGK